eukprot:COSAG01_NODE_608_length_14865_cov_5.517879_11_plen_260_part_00
MEDSSIPHALNVEWNCIAHLSEHVLGKPLVHPPPPGSTRTRRCASWLASCRSCRTTWGCPRTCAVITTSSWLNGGAQSELVRGGRHTHHGAVPVLKREGRRRLTSAAETDLDFGSEIVQPRSSRSWASGAFQSIISYDHQFCRRPQSEVGGGIVAHIRSGRPDAGERTRLRRPCTCSVSYVSVSVSQNVGKSQSNQDCRHTYDAEMVHEQVFSGLAGAFRDRDLDDVVAIFVVRRKDERAANLAPFSGGIYPAPHGDAA